MADADRLRACFGEGTLLHPLATAGTVALSRALAAIAGAPWPAADAQADEIQSQIGDRDHIVFVLADGLGMNLLEAYDDGAFLREHVVRELRAVFPSSTAPALTSLATCTWPATHGATGWWTYIPAIGHTITLLPFADRFIEKPAEQLGLTGDVAFATPTPLSSATRDIATVMPKWIAGSTYSRYTASGHPIHAYGSLAEGVDVVAARIRASRTRTYTYLYVPIIDGEEHEHGWTSWQTRRALAETRREIERLSHTGGGIRIVVSADHGQIEVPDASKIIWRKSEPILRHLRFPPTCEPRSAAFHCRDGAGAAPAREAFASEFRDRYGEHFALLTLDEAESEQLFGPGPFTDETRARLGDFIAVAVDDSVLMYEPHPDLRKMRGFHGGLTAGEMRIPLIVI